MPEATNVPQATPELSSNETELSSSEDGLELTSGHEGLSFPNNPSTSKSPVLTRNNILLLQRTIGNQKVQRLINRQREQSVASTFSNHNHDNTPVQAQTNELNRLLQAETANLRGNQIQRFSQGDITPDHRRSDGGNFFQIDRHTVYATPKAIEDANEALEAAGSFVKIIGTDQGPGDMKLQYYRRIKLRWVGGERAKANLVGFKDIYKLTPTERRDLLIRDIDSYIERYQDPEFLKDLTPVERKEIPQILEELKREKAMLTDIVGPGADDVFVTPRDCHEVAQVVMGATRDGTQEKLDLRDGDGQVQVSLSEKGRGISGAIANRGVNTFFTYAFPRFLALLTRDETNADIFDALTTFGATKITDAKSLKAAYEIYEKIQKNGPLAKLFNETFGVNEYVKPQVGHSMTQVNDEFEVDRFKAQAQKGIGKFLWNFHWAGVLMVDGGDYLTLQAVAEELKNGVTFDWYFKTYGADAQSFHSQEKMDTHVGSRPLTLGFVNS